MSKSGILGDKVGMKEALGELGDPGTWKGEREQLERRFKTRPVVWIRYGLSQRLSGVLNQSGIGVAALQRMSDTELRKVAGIGPSEVTEIRARVKKTGSRVKRVAAARRPRRR